MTGLDPIDATGVARLGNLLTVWAHPDDETYLAGGLMAAAVAAGTAVTCVVATNGERGGPPEQEEELSVRREHELREAMSALGVSDVVALRLPDGGCADLDPAGPVDALTKLLDDRAPDTVVTFGPEGFTGHGDHRAVSAWVRAALGRAAAAPRLLHAAITPDIAAEGADVNTRFGVYDPGLPATIAEAELAAHLTLHGSLLDTKIRALRAHASQTSALEGAIGVDRYRQWVSHECFVDAER
jgi:LmbE family N-acetylglucosaminyl deacetylase